MKYVVHSDKVTYMKHKEFVKENLYFLFDYVPECLRLNPIQLIPQLKSTKFKL